MYFSIQKYTLGLRARIHRIECNVPTLWQRKREKNKERSEIQDKRQNIFLCLSITEHYYRSSPAFHVGDFVSQFCQEQSDNLELSHQGFPLSTPYFHALLCDWQLEMLLCHDPHDTWNAKAPGVLRWCQVTSIGFISSSNECDKVMIHGEDPKSSGRLRGKKKSFVCGGSFCKKLECAQMEEDWHGKITK